MPAEKRPDLAAMLLPVSRAMIEVELPVLRAHELSMWGYGVLLRLDERPVRTQAALAEAIGADKTRIIAVLDDLQERGWITREPDPADRRARLLALTAEGRRVRDSAQRGIRAREAEILARFPAADRDVFLRVLRTLHETADTGALLAEPAPGG